MAKALALTPDALNVAPITPQAATPARRPIEPAKPVAVAKPAHVPLQIKIPQEDVRAIKIAAAESGQTISELMLACWHASQKTVRNA